MSWFNKHKVAGNNANQKNKMNNSNVTVNACNDATSAVILAEIMKLHEKVDNIKLAIIYTTEGTKHYVSNNGVTPKIKKECNDKFDKALEVLN